MGRSNLWAQIMLLRLKKTLGEKAGHIRLQPVCSRDLSLAKEVLVEP